VKSKAIHSVVTTFWIFKVFAEALKIVRNIDFIDEMNLFNRNDNFCLFAHDQHMDYY